MGALCRPGYKTAVSGRCRGIVGTPVLFPLNRQFVANICSILGLIFFDARRVFVLQFRLYVNRSSVGDTPMIRKLILSTIAIAAMMLGAFAPSAVAQDDATPTPTPVVCTVVGYNGCIAYPQGGFVRESTPVPTATPGPTSSAVVSADNVDATTADTSGSGSGGASIAFTGSESRVLGYAGAGLIGFGAIALAVARRKSDTDLD